ncbi:MAG TPA: SDR family oxidoreductase [Candidatus Binatia bacterium]
MADHVAGKSIIVTGAGSGFGRLVSERLAARGAKVACADVNLDAVEAVKKAITERGGSALALHADVANLADMRALAKATVDAFGAIDVLVNNAGIMPLAFYADHAAAVDAWHRCIDVNLKGVLNGIVAVYDQMIAQGRGHVVNLSSIYGNYPVVGAAVYGATKAAVNFLSESLRVETRGKIKVTIVKPTGVPTTGLAGTVINQAAAVGILGQNTNEFMEMFAQITEGRFPAENLDPESIAYPSLAPEFIADAIVHAIDQPWGVSIGDVTVRAAGDHFIL